MKSLNLLSYNIHKGFTTRNRRYVLSSMREAIRDLNADIVALQEVTGENSRHAQKRPDWHHEGHFEFLADQVWPHYAYGKNAIYQSGHHGNALLSKYPFDRVNNHDISQSSYSRRSILHAPISLPDTEAPDIHISCVHLGFLPYEQFRQWKLLDQWLLSLGDDTPVILMGDFNDWHKRIHKQLTRKHGLQEVIEQQYGRLQPTYPAKKPQLAVDRIYYRGLTLKQSRICHEPHWRELSDHCPVSAELEL